MRVLLLLTILVAGCAQPEAPPVVVATPAAETPFIRWEYKVATLDYYQIDDKGLGLHGRDGWELATVSDAPPVDGKARWQLIFKRPFRKPIDAP